MRLVTPITDLRTGCDRYGVWEYDEARPRNPQAHDPRQRFAVRYFVGSFATRAEAEGAMA